MPSPWVQDFPAFCIHQHAWPLVTSRHLAGIHYTAEGLLIKPGFPKRLGKFAWSSPHVSIKWDGNSTFEGHYAITPPRDIAERPRGPSGVAAFMPSHSKTPYITPSTDFYSRNGVVWGRRGPQLEFSLRWRLGRGRGHVDDVCERHCSTSSHGQRRSGPQQRWDINTNRAKQKQWCGGLGSCVGTVDSCSHVPVYCDYPMTGQLQYWFSTQHNLEYRRDQALHAYTAAPLYAYPLPRQQSYAPVSNLLRCSALLPYADKRVVSCQDNVVGSRIIFTFAFTGRPTCDSQLRAPRKHQPAHLKCSICVFFALSYSA